MSLSAQDFELLLQSNRILSSKLDVNDVLQAVMELATKVVKAEASSLLLLDEKKNELYFDVALGSVKDSVKQLRLKVGEGIAGWVAKEKQPLVVNDVTKDPRFTGKIDRSTQFKTKSLLAVPMLAKGRLIGVVEAINKELGQDFNETDKEAFEIFASQSAIAIENARLFSAVTNEKKKLNTVFAEMTDGVLLLDGSGRALILNPSGERLLGFTNGQALGKKVGADLFADFDTYPSLPELKALKGGMAVFELIRKKGKDLYVSALVNKLEAADEADGAYLVMLRDITEERREEKLKRSFLSLVSHKLKTPLTVILGYAPVLSSTLENLNPLQKKAVKAMSEQSEQLSGLVDKLLRFTIVESENLKLNIESKSLAEILRDAVAAMGHALEDKKVAVTVHASVGALPSVQADAALLMDVFRNLIDNAVKFNDKEKKTIEISAEKNAHSIVTHVDDNGAGIPAEEFGRIFQKFYQIENSFTGQVPGAGLGLALCRRAVEEMGGKIDVASDIGKGSRFSVTLPCR